MSLQRLLILGLAAVAGVAIVVVVLRARSEGEPWWRTLLRSIKPLALIGVGLFVAIQFVPYGREHDNPPVLAEPEWDSPQTRELAVTSCFDCHSNETVWPWYSNVAPVSWFIQRDVNIGRSKVNWSEWMVDGDEDNSDEAAETVEEGSMPLSQYVWLHPEAGLTDQEVDILAAGLEATFGRHDE